MCLKGEVQYISLTSCRNSDMNADTGSVFCHPDPTPSNHEAQSGLSYRTSSEPVVCGHGWEDVTSCDGTGCKFWSQDCP